MSLLYTIGTQGRSLEQFITALRQASVDAVIDIRLRNTSQLAGYSKKDDLAFLLREGFHIAYEHRPELGPSDEILDGYHRDHDWGAYEAAFIPLLQERRAEVAGKDIVARYRAPCLLCSEAKPAKCHRRLVAEYWAVHLPGVQIIHL
jgi:uncharacterized protein (DUF488 family)